MRIDDVVWDMDGTLVDSTRVVPDAFVRAVATLNGPVITSAEVVAAYPRGTPEVILSFLVGRELSPDEHDVYYRQLDGVAVSAYPGVLATLAALREKGRPVAVFTGASTRSARILLAAAGIDADVVIGGDQVSRPKPAPDGMLLAARRLGTRPDRLALVGDSPLDLRAARSAGSVSVSAAWGHLYDPAEPADVTLSTPGEALALVGSVVGDR
ncbi:HAD family hydrolase [Actinoplanes couchii]|uniref:Phosphoglycolate phosphatase n=1 Tax=Actinoplanes couchii TaxID=403638 RepID=A0ABQ3XDB6_9ACTN|nr:HAD-IA family hydrolase [Actinoplanes couchii]MDR6321392.1 HAD superfamily hydrolase (TIGR01509 family) [Actinoplanes couchii]GID56502.1 phosphoglycolate phosphatase [Actinoplanes couchii]